MTDKYFDFRLVMNEISLRDVTKTDLLKLFFSPDDIKIATTPIFEDNLKKLSLCFDLNGDGVYTVEDLEYFKTLDMLIILKLVNATSYVMQLLPNLTSVSADLNTEIVFKLIVFAAVLPATANISSFREWLNRSQNKNLLIECFETIKNTIKASVDAKKVMECASQIFQTTSCGKKKNIVGEITKIVSNDVSTIVMNNKTYLTDKKISELEKKLSELENK